MKTIVSTKILSQEQKAILSVLPIHLIEHNFITVSPITMSLTPPYDLLIVTSQNAVKSLSQHPFATTLKENSTCVFFYLNRSIFSFISGDFFYF